MDENRAVESAPDDDDPDMEDVFEQLDVLAETVDTEREREQVRETRRTLREAQQRGAIGRLQSTFDFRDAGEALLGSFLFGIPMIVEDGTLTAGRHIAGSPLAFATTLVLGLGLVFGIFHAVKFERISGDFLFGVVPLRLLGILTISGSLALVLLTLWGRVAWTEPYVASGQLAVTAIVMAVGASLGDILTET